MNLQLQRMLKLRGLYSEPAGEGGSNTGGTGTGGEGGEGGEGEGAPAGGEGGEGGEGEGAPAKKPAQPTDAEAKLLKEVMKQKERANTAASQLSALQAQIDALTALGGAEKFKQLLEAAEADETKKAEARGEYDRLIKQMGEKHTTEKGALQAQIEAAKAATSAAVAQIAEITVGAAFTGSAFISDETNLSPRKARVIYGTHFEFKDGAVVAYDKPTGASDRTMLVDSTGNPLAFEAAIEALVEADPDRDTIRRSKAKRGAGSGTLNPKAGEREKLLNEGAQQLSSTDKILVGLRKLAQSK